MPSLYAVDDKSKGDSGGRSEAWKVSENGIAEIVGDRPIVGCRMLVGAIGARTMSWQDYWLTTEVLEILEEREDYVKFRTKNTTYEWSSESSELVLL